MRRKDREVADPQAIYDMLAACDTLHIGMSGDEVPYVVPVSFGLEQADGQAVVYFHSAKAGRKVDLLSAGARVGVTADRFLGVQKTAHGITTRYLSVMGKGRCEAVTDENEVLHALKLITEHYGATDYPLTRCKGLEDVRIYRIRLEELSGKKNAVDSD